MSNWRKLKRQNFDRITDRMGVLRKTFHEVGGRLKIIALEKENEYVSEKNFQALLREEAAVVWKLYQRNILREIYFRSDKKNAVLILECDSIQQADKILADLPLVKNNIIKFELIGLKPYNGLERLFESK